MCKFSSMFDCLKHLWECTVNLEKFGIGRPSQRCNCFWTRSTEQTEVHASTQTRVCHFMHANLQKRIKPHRVLKTLFNDSILQKKCIKIVNGFETNFNESLETQHRKEQTRSMLTTESNIPNQCSFRPKCIGCSPFKNQFFYPFDSKALKGF